MDRKVGGKPQKTTLKKGAFTSKSKQSDLHPDTNSSVDQVLNLQKTAGNQAVQGLLKSGVLQPKLKIGEPGDKYEMEADRMAEQVMRMPDSVCPSCVEKKEEEKLQRKPLSSEDSTFVQRDVEDEERKKKEEEIIQAKPLSAQITPIVQRQVEDIEKKKREEEMFQAKEDSGGLNTTADIDSNINNLRGKGEPLPETARNYFEPRFGYDFSGVRIHTGDEAAKTAKSINARAFTTGKEVIFGSGQYAPDSETGKSLLAHELTHVVQQKETIKYPYIAKSPGAPTKTKDDASTDVKKEEDPLAGWTTKSSGNYVLFLGTGDQLFVLPARGILFLPSEEALKKYRSEPAKLGWDVGTLFEVPAAGASATRVVRKGNKKVMILDSGTGVPAALYLEQLTDVLLRSGARRAELWLRHGHKDHAKEAPNVAELIPLSPEDVKIPGPLLSLPMVQEIIEKFRAKGGVWKDWTPSPFKGDPIRSEGIVYTTHIEGEFKIETVALRSALLKISTTRKPSDPVIDKASYMTKITRMTDGAKVVDMIDLRLANLGEMAMEMDKAAAESTGIKRIPTFSQFMQGVEITLGFSHHAGRMELGDIAGLRRLFEETLFRTGKLRMIIQTDPTRHKEAREDTIDFLRRTGAEVILSERPVPGTPSAAGATRDVIYGRGPGAKPLGKIESSLTKAAERISRLCEARETIKDWRAMFESRGAKPSEINRIIEDINKSINDIRDRSSKALEALARIRIEGERLPGPTRQGEVMPRNYETGPKAEAYKKTLEKITVETSAEKGLREKGFKYLESLRLIPPEKIPTYVAVEQALRTGKYNPKAFRYMIAELDPATRDSIFGRGDQKKGKTYRPPFFEAFEQVRQQFGFQRAIMAPVPGIKTFGHMSRGGRIAMKGAGWMALLGEGMNIYSNIDRAMKISAETNRSKNVYPFLNRILFWDQFGVRPSVVAVDEGVFSNDYYRDTGKIIKNMKDWDALYIEHTSSHPALSNAEIFKFVIVLASVIRNFNEFCQVFIDTDQDAIRWTKHGPRNFKDLIKLFSGSAKEKKEFLKRYEEMTWEDMFWEVHVGHYETSGINHVEQRWVHIPLLTEAMRVFVKRLIKQTSMALKFAGTTPEVLSETGTLGELPPRFYRKPLYKAKLKNPKKETEVLVETADKDKPERIVEWWTEPVFYVYEDKGKYAEVGGADYNTFAILRKLRRMTSQYVASEHFWGYEYYEAANTSGMVSIPRSKIERIPDEK